MTPPFLEWYNPDAHCEYHDGVAGHTIEDCAPFIDEMQKLIESGVLSYTIMEQLINEVDREDRDIALTIPDSYIGMDENTVECSVQSWDMINFAFAEELKREKRIANLMGATLEGEPMVFPHLRETFYSVEVQYDNIRPSGTAIFEDFEKLSINAIKGMEVKGEDVRAMVHLMSPRAAPRNWTTIDIHNVFHLSK
ncbi:hypothetical protein CRYUN_Cryun01aG0085000 [Craigia yunnanensis]